VQLSAFTQAFGQTKCTVSGKGADLEHGMGPYQSTKERQKLSLQLSAQHMGLAVMLTSVLLDLL
jgi:hypothetical protein